MTSDISIPSVFIFLIAVFFSAVSQVLLKKSAISDHANPLQEYLNWRVLLGYTIMFGCTLLSAIAYRNLPLSFGMMLETTSYIYVTIFGLTIFKEKINSKKMIALSFIVAGIFLYMI